MTRVAGQVVYLPLDRLRVAATNPRKTQPQRSPGHGPLRDSIAAQGILNPLTVVPNGDYFDVVCGYRRLTAARELKLPDAPCVVRPLNRLQQLELGLTDNINRGRMDPVDVGIALLAMRDEGLSQMEIARRIGRNQGYVSRFIRVAQLPPEMRNQVKQKKLTVSAALNTTQGAPRAGLSVFEADEQLHKAWTDLRESIIGSRDRAAMVALQTFASCWRDFGRAKASAVVPGAAAAAAR